MNQYLTSDRVNEIRTHLTGHIGEAVTLCISLGPTITGTLGSTNQDRIVLTDKDGTTWTVHASNVAAVGTKP